MKYRYLKNNRAVATSSTDDLSVLNYKCPTFANKAEYREWCAKDTTDHCFYSMSEGDAPSARVSTDNPVNKLHGFVADFDDVPVDWDNVDQILKTRCDGTPMPTWRSKTYSGFIRLVWEFDSPLPIAADLAPAFLKRLCDALKASMLLGGFDKTSLKPSQYFEIGTNWTKIGDTIPISFARTILLNSANDTPLKTSNTN